MLDCRGGSELSMPLCLLSEYVCSKILSETDPQNLEITVEINTINYADREKFVQLNR